MILTFQSVGCQWPRLRSHLIQVHLKMNREKRLYFAVLVFQTGIHEQSGQWRASLINFSYTYKTVRGFLTSNMFWSSHAIWRLIRYFTRTHSDISVEPKWIWKLLFAVVGEYIVSYFNRIRIWFWDIWRRWRRWLSTRNLIGYRFGLSWNYFTRLLGFIW